MRFGSSRRRSRPRSSWYPEGVHSRPAGSLGEQIPGFREVLLEDPLVSVPTESLMEAHEA